jgi:mannosyltransferase
VETGQAGRRYQLAVAALTLLAALLRFPTLDTQSFWLDESITVLLVDQPLGDVLGDLPDVESNPPLYDLLAWLWSRPFGTGEVGLRSLSALAGTATVALIGLGGRRVLGARTSLALALLAALSPFLVWYSQEARAYALLVLLTTAGLLLFLHALEEPSRRTLVWWALVSSLALTTHYYAALLVIPQAAWLALRGRDRRNVLLAAALPAATLLALVPLAIAEHGNAGASGVDEASLSGRLESVPRKFLAGEYGGPVRGLAPLAAVAAGAALVLLAMRATQQERRRVALPLALGAVGVGIPALAAMGGFDYFTSRYVSIAWVPLFAVVAAGVTVSRAGRLGPLLAAGLASLFLTCSIAVPLTPRLQRDDWRGAAADLGHPALPRAIVVSPAVGFLPLRVYSPEIAAPPGDPFAVRQVAQIAMTRDDDRPVLASPVAGMTQVLRHDDATYSVAIHQSPALRRVSRAQLLAQRLTPDPVGFVYDPGGR